MSRPWEIPEYAKDRCIIWLKERGGVVVYENHVLDSSSLGDKTFLPARYISEDDEMKDAPEWFTPSSHGMPSQRQQRVDTVTLEEFDGDINRALACFDFAHEEA